jgi:glycolate oxidase
MNSDLLPHLSRELGGRVVTEPEAMEPFGRDESGCGFYPPEAVVRPTSPEEVRIALRLCAEHRAPVTPRGAGTGKSGGALPVHGGVVLSLDRMNAILDIDRASRLAVVEPGVITGTLQAAVEAEGLFYPPDPASLESCTLGGNVAENAGGPRAYRYGVTREYVLGMEVALLAGDRLQLGRRSPKGVSGYDLGALVVGSEGTLAVVDRLTLRLLPRPEAALAALAVFRSLPDAARAVLALDGLGVVPRALELMDAISIDHVREGSAYRFPEDLAAALLIEVDGEAEALPLRIQRCAEACEAAGAVDVRIAQDEAQRRRLWEARRRVSEALTQGHRRKAADDVAVPVGEITRIIPHLHAIGERHGLRMALYGHVGDGNLHVNFLADDPDDAKVARAIDAARVDLFHQVLQHGGTLSGEHGIGLAKRQFMLLEHAPEELELMRALKRLWDPLGLLNPGKLLPDPC